MVSVDGMATCNPRGFLLPGKHDKRICDMLRKTAHWILLWGLFFLICFGLGYPSLNRYDPRLVPGLSDSNEYYELVGGNPQAATGHFRYRVLIPYLAKPFYWLAKGQVGTWNPVFFGFLVANAMFTATSACMLVFLGYTAVGDYAVALLGAMLYLVNFNVPNTFLGAGAVDSGESCLMLATTWAMATARWSLLPFLGVVGALAKETFVPFSIVFCMTWLVMLTRQEGYRLSQLASVIVMGVAGLTTVTVLQSTISGHIIWPWDIALAENSNVSFSSMLDEPTMVHSFIYVFGWLLPLGAWHLMRLPQPWVVASLAASLTAFALGVWVGSLGGVPRAIFNVAGPLLALSAASLLMKIKILDSR